MRRPLEIQIFPRVNTDCTAPYVFYRCSKGPFTGCCASDPCSTGICPEDDLPKDGSGSGSDSSGTTSESTSEEPTTSESTSEEPTTSESASEEPTTSESVSEEPTTSEPSSSAVPPFSSTSPDTNIPSQPIPTSILTQTFPTIDSPSATVSSTSSASSIPATTETGAIISSEQPGSSSNNGALIGGIVGGVVGGLLIIALFLFWFIRRRREQKPEPATEASYAETEKPKEPSGVVILPDKSEGDGDGETTNELEGCHDTRTSKTISELYTTSDQSSPYSSPMLSQVSPSIGSPATASSPGMSRETPLTTLSESYSSYGREPRWNSHELFVSFQAPGQSHSRTISELTDTSRVELPGDLGPDPRVTQDPYAQRNHGISQPQGTGRGAVSGELSVTTPDGVVLTPNLNQADEQQNRSRTAEPHVMSFMDYRGEQFPG